MSLFEKVEKFNKNIIGIDRKDIQELCEDEANWLVSALKEEIDEFIQAHSQHDFINQIDAIIDLLYFSMGALTRMGIPFEISEAFFDVVHECNMQKVKGCKEERDVTSDLDAVKPSNWVEPSAAFIDILNEARK